MADKCWKKTTVGSLCDAGILHTQTGPFGSQLHSYDYVPSGVPVVPTDAIGRRHLATKGIPHISKKKASQLSRHRVQPGDILFARRGIQATGFSAIVSPSQDGWICGTGAILLRIIGQEVDPNFLSFYLSESQTISWLKQHAVGAVMPNLNEGIIRQLPVTFPPLSIQKAIAYVLCSLDDMIDLNRRMNETLEGIARAFFQSWFVDFDPVRAKLDGRTPYGMDQATADLFPDSFEDSSLGPIPKGWRVESVGNLTTRVTKGDTPRKEAVATCAPIEPMVRMLRVNALTDDGEILLDKAELIPQSIHFGKSKRSILEPNDILYTNAGTIGRVAFVQEHHLPANTNQAMAIVRPNADSVPPLYLYLAMRHEEFQSALHQDIVHAVQPNLALGKISNARLVLPHDKILTRLWPTIDSLVKQVFHNRITNQILASLRDTLLPKLLSGELSVDEAGRCVEQAV